MTVPAGLFTSDALGVTGVAQQSSRAIAPIEWLLRQPATVRWWAKTVAANLAALTRIDTAITIPDGHEGIVMNMALLQKADVQGANSGIEWFLLVNQIPVVQTQWIIAGGATLNDGGFDYLWEGDGAGSSWGKIDFPVPEAGLVQVVMRNNGGNNAPMEWALWGIYWPLVLNDLWAKKGWRGK